MAIFLRSVPDLGARWHAKSRYSKISAIRTKPIARRSCSKATSRRRSKSSRRSPRIAASPPERLTFIYAPTHSLAGNVQVVARVLEVALHKVHELKFPLANILDGIASAPMSPPHPDFITAMGRTNDAIIYGGFAHLFVTGPAAAARDLAMALPSTNSRDYGRPFAEVFKAFNFDFYKIDPMLFSPAVAMVTAVESGETFRAGQVSQDLLDASFG